MIYSFPIIMLSNLSLRVQQLCLPLLGTMIWFWIIYSTNLEYIIMLKVCLQLIFFLLTCQCSFGNIQKIMWKLNKSIAKELLPTQPVDFPIEPWWGVCLVNFTLEEFKVGYVYHPYKIAEDLLILWLIGSEK